MMDRRDGGQGQFFYSFNLDRVVPPDHLVRQIVPSRLTAMMSVQSLSTLAGSPINGVRRATIHRD
jgi:hypothetical protein